ncbi:gas vesicle protein GvpN [Synechococcus sp. Nb3U1]|uniref:gas vesicle protein GvpN n=1 Tax=Synechococcus sp. Nb3U1 TaxID=1914529 RepID=UPI001F2CE7BE|nr:gas vesicle protein GvpN [Synechococcus sp. Nb3U1]MCF2970628.1 gas vesicle protein GvpN [Synechococcus sp. Nb3U1]
MATVLQARPRQFVNTTYTERIVRRALRYLQSGFAVHLRGPSGTGKTTLAMHLASLMGRPIMLIYGDDRFDSSDLIGGRTGFTHRRVVDNYIHSVVKTEEDLQQRWVDARLTLACREGFTLIYDEFNRSRPEANNALLSALEEKLLVMPPDSNRSEYLRVHPQFRAIFTSNPEEYTGVHKAQDALLDRMITIDMGEPDIETEKEILISRLGLSAPDALKIVHVVRAFRRKLDLTQHPSLRSCLMIGRIVKEHELSVSKENVDFRALCGDVLLARAGKRQDEGSQLLNHLLDQLPG